MSKIVHELFKSRGLLFALVLGGASVAFSEPPLRQRLQSLQPDVPLEEERAHEVVKLLPQQKSLFGVTEAVRPYLRELILNADDRAVVYDQIQSRLSRIMDEEPSYDVLKGSLGVVFQLSNLAQSVNADTPDMYTMREYIAKESEKLMYQTRTSVPPPPKPVLSSKPVESLDDVNESNILQNKPTIFIRVLALKKELEALLTVRPSLDVLAGPIRTVERLAQTHANASRGALPTYIQGMRAWLLDKALEVTEQTPAGYIKAASHFQHFSGAMIRKIAITAYGNAMSTQEAIHLIDSLGLPPASFEVLLGYPTLISRWKAEDDIKAIGDWLGRRARQKESFITSLTGRELLDRLVLDKKITTIEDYTQAHRHLIPKGETTWVKRDLDNLIELNPNLKLDGEAFLKLLESLKDPVQQNAVFILALDRSTFTDAAKAKQLLAHRRRIHPEFPFPDEKIRAFEARHRGLLSPGYRFKREMLQRLADFCGLPPK